MIILGIDVETTGLEPDDQIIELGQVIYDSTAKKIISLHSDLFKTTKWGDEAEAVHHISQDMSQTGYDEAFDPWALVAQYKPQLIVAHNKEYDKGFVVPRWPNYGSLPWLCTKNDLNHETKLKYVSSTRLQHLAVDYGFEAGQRHRALFDALVCAEIAAQHDLDAALAHLLEPKFVVQAWHEGRPDFQSPDFNTQKEYLKLAGFKWDGARWTRDNVPQSQVDKYVALASTKPGWKATATAK